jgi:hypothetical protein
VAINAIAHGQALGQARLSEKNSRKGTDSRLSRVLFGFAVAFLVFQISSRKGAQGKADPSCSGGWRPGPCQYYAQPQRYNLQQHKSTLP